MALNIILSLVSLGLIYWVITLIDNNAVLKKKIRRRDERISQVDAINEKMSTNLETAQRNYSLVKTQLSKLSDDYRELLTRHTLLQENCKG